MMAFIQWVNWPGVIISLLLVFAYNRIKAFEETLPNFHVADMVRGPDGKVDKYSVGYMMVLGVMTWAMIFLTLKDRLTEWYVTCYVGAFIIGALGKTVSTSYEKTKTDTTISEINLKEVKTKPGQEE